MFKIRQIIERCIRDREGSHDSGASDFPENTPAPDSAGFIWNLRRDGIFLADGYLDGDQLVRILYLGGLPGSADLCDSGCCGILYLECYISDDSVKADRRKTGTDSDQTWDFLIKEWGRT